MKLHSPPFEKTLKRGVRKAIKSSRELKREFRANRFRKHYHFWLLVRPAISVVFASYVWKVMDKTGHPASALAFINLWAFVFISIHAQRWLNCLFRASDLPALLTLPVTETTIFRWERQKCVRGTLWSLLDLLGGYSALAVYYHFPVSKWFAVIPIALVAWAEVFALSALCAAYLPRFPYLLVSCGFFLIGLGIVFAQSIVGTAVLSFIESCASGLNLLLPTGWPASLFQILLPDGQWLSLILLLPIGVAIWLLRNASAQLQANCGFREPVLPEAPDLIPGQAAQDPIAEAADQSKPQRVGPTAIEEIIQARQFLEAPSWHQRGWFEGLLWRWFSCRERALVEFVFPEGLSILSPWRKIFRHLFIACLGTIAAALIIPAGKYWVLAAGLFVTFCQVFNQIFSVGRAFQPVHCSGVNIPLYAGFAIGYRELSQVLFKCSLVQFPLLLSFTVAAGLLVCLSAKFPIAAGALIGIKVSGLLLLGRLMLVAFAFSSGTNDTSRIRLRSVLILLTVVICCLGFVALGASSLFVPAQGVAWLLWGMAALVAYGFFRLYGWFYHANRFDLMSLPPR